MAKKSKQSKTKVGDDPIETIILKLREEAIEFGEENQELREQVKQLKSLLSATTADAEAYKRVINLLALDCAVQQSVIYSFVEYEEAEELAVDAFQEQSPEEWYKRRLETTILRIDRAAQLLLREAKSYTDKPTHEEAIYVMHNRLIRYKKEYEELLANQEIE